MSGLLYALFQCRRVAVCTGLTMFSEIEFCPALSSYIKEVSSFFNARKKIIHVINSLL